MENEMFDLDNADFIKFHEERYGIPVFDDPDDDDFTKYCLTDPAAEEFLLHSPDYKFPWGAPVPLGEDRILAVKLNRLIKVLLQDSWKLFKDRRQNKIGHGSK